MLLPLGFALLLQNPSVPAVFCCRALSIATLTPSLGDPGRQESLETQPGAGVGNGQRFWHLVPWLRVVQKSPAQGSPPASAPASPQPSPRKAGAEPRPRAQGRVCCLKAFQGLSRLSVFFLSVFEVKKYATVFNKSLGMAYDKTRKCNSD